MKNEEFDDQEEADFDGFEEDAWEDDDQADEVAQDQKERIAQQARPEINLSGEPLPENLEFFCMPRDIGPLICGHSDLIQGTQPKSERNRSNSIMIGIVVGGLIGIAITIGAGLDSPMAIASAVGIPILLGLVLAVKKTTFAPTNFLIGTQGFAEYACVDSRENLVKEFEVHFEDVTDLNVDRIVKYNGPHYSKTVFAFRWINQKTGKLLYESTGAYHTLKLFPDPVSLTFSERCEIEYAKFRLAGLAKTLAKNGYESFFHCIHQGNTLTEYIRISHDSITFIKGSRDHTTYKFTDLEPITLKENMLHFRHRNYDSKSGVGAGLKDLIPMDEMSNQKYLLCALSILLGYRMPGLNSFLV